MTGFAYSPDVVASLARRLFGEPNRRLSTGRELRWGRRGSLAVLPERGVFCDHEAGRSGGVLDMVVHAGAAATRGEAARLLEQGGDFPLPDTDWQRSHRQLTEGKERTEHRLAAWALWKAAGPIAGTVAEAYLRTARGVHAPLEQADVGFLRAAPFYPYKPDHHRFPALLAGVRDGRGKLTGVHLTYLQPDGRGKAEVTPSRKMAGTVAGGHVRLIPGNRLVVAEGLESAFSAWDAAGDAQDGSVGDLGAVAAMSAAGVSGLEWPADTTALIIAPDRDASGTGERAARELARRASAAGLSVGFLFPPEGCGDWNDAARKGGVA